MESKQIKLSTYQLDKGGYGVYVSELSGEVLNLFSKQLGSTEPIVKTRSERLKALNTFKAATDYIDRFYSLPLQEQVNKISHKSVKLDTKQQKKGVGVVTGVQYYRLKLNGRDLGTAYRLDEIANLRKLWPNLVMEKTIVKQMLFDKDEYETYKHYLTLIPAKPKGRLKSDITTEFKGIYTKRK